MKYKATAEGVVPFTDAELDQWEIDNAYFSKKTIRDAVDKIRSKRDGLLNSSDWTQLPDVPMTDQQKTAWQTYRQALRDITDRANFPWLDDADWPVKPE